MKTQRIGNTIRSCVERIKYPRPKDYSQYVKISDKLPDESYNLIAGIKSVIGNFAEKNRLVLSFNEVPNKPDKVRLKTDKYYYDVMPMNPFESEMAQNVSGQVILIPKFKRIKNLTLNLNSNSDESPIRTIYEAVSKALSAKK